MRLKAYIEVIRLPNALLSGLGAVLSMLVYFNYSVNSSLLPLLATAFVTGFLLTGSCMAVNDVVDLEVDRVNKPWKPLPRGDISRRATIALAAGMAITPLVLNLVFGVAQFVVATLYATVGISYSFLRRHWWSHFLVALSTTGPIVYSYVVAGLPPDDLSFTALFSLTIVVVTLGREFLKAIQDVEGDSIHGYRTVATVLGTEGASKLALAVSIVSSLLGAITAAFRSSMLYRFLIIVASTLYLYFMLNALRLPGDKKRLESARRKTLHAMTVGMMAFWVSKFP